ncbi:MAG TPA: ATP-binding protein, partial [Pyrinomonadaceae bacterium]|nr:ATP-binding protein [Pyrinomonadaceae bacterium]
VESKLQVPVTLAESSCNRLEDVAKRAGFTRVQLWLIANEGFSDAALKLLSSRSIYSSSRAQFELLAARLFTATAPTTAAANEYELVLPMGSDNELLAAGTAEQLARRLNFRSEAISQIKTAIVEACINASEHSLSPDQKIYQRFRVEDDKLVITISSRGVLPENPGEPEIPAENQRRGWGLKLIKTLMDEVEFERVDEGTRLRMVKYVR